MKKIEDIDFLTDTGCLAGMDLYLPLPERLEKIRHCMGDPYAYVNSDGIKVKINYTDSKTIDQVLFEHFTSETAGRS